jgi:hypothetical protein
MSTSAVYPTRRQCQVHSTNALVLSSCMDNPVKRQILEYMAREGIKPAEFSDRSGITPGTLSLIIGNVQGKPTSPEAMKVRTLRQAARTIGISMDQLLTGRPPDVFVDSSAQLENHLTALQIVARSFATALRHNAPGAARDSAAEILKEAEGKEGEKPFAVDSGLLFEVLGNLGLGHLAAEASAATKKRAGSAAQPKQ